MMRLVALLLAVAPTAVLAQGTPRGQILFLQCRACHSVEAGGANKVGPNLGKLFTRPALGAAGFKYSAAFFAAKPGWTAASLNNWLERPSAVVKGTSMTFAGMAKPEDRAALIAWLQTATR